jgi:hypothetical protein
VPLTPAEKVQIRRHLAYLNVSVLSTFIVGLPAGVETQFLIERAMSTLILEDALPMIREVLCQLDAVEAQRASVRGSIGVEQIGNIKLRDPTAALDALNREFVRLIGDLSNAFGVGRMPFDHRGGTFGIPVS